MTPRIERPQFDDPTFDDVTDEAHRLPFVVETLIQSRVKDNGMPESADRLIGQLRDGKPTPELTAEEASAGVFPESWSEWKEKGEAKELDQLRAAQSDGTSMLERPSPTESAGAYWREADSTLVRVAPPAFNMGWCVNHYFPLPSGR